MKSFLKQSELSALWDISERTLEGWRCRGDQGPGYNKFGNRVRYPREEVERFERENFQDIMKHRNGCGRDPSVNWVDEDDLPQIRY